MPTPHRIGFIGAGNMAGAMIGAMIRSGRAAPSSLFISDVSTEKARLLQQSTGVVILNDNAAVVRHCDTVIFAVKPQQLDDVLLNLTDVCVFKNIRGRKRLMSIIAGAPIRRFEAALYAGLDEDVKCLLPILRVMPNTPALVGKGVSGLCGNSVATSEDLAAAQTLLSAMGQVIRCQETAMDGITALSGSGPAYCFYFLEAMIEAGVQLGFSMEDAATLTTATFEGALALLENQKLPPQALRKNVTSPGGTTEAAVAVLENRSVKQAIRDAIFAAASRSRELSR